MKIVFFAGIVLPAAIATVFITDHFFAEKCGKNGYVLYLKKILQHR